MASVPEVLAPQAMRYTSCPATIDPGGVTTVGLVVLVPLSDGVDAVPKRVIAMLDDVHYYVCGPTALGNCSVYFPRIRIICRVICWER